MPPNGFQTRFRFNAAGSERHSSLSLLNLTVDDGANRLRTMSQEIQHRFRRQQRRPRRGQVISSAGNG